jgi:hypothetical protein
MGELDQAAPDKEAKLNGDDSGPSESDQDVFHEANLSGWRYSLLCVG